MVTGKVNGAGQRLFRTEQQGKRAQHDEKSDDGEMPYGFSGPVNGGYFRVVQSRGRSANYDPAADRDIVPLHEPRPRPAGRAWDCRDNNGYSGMHKTESVDYGISLDAGGWWFSTTAIPMRLGDHYPSRRIASVAHYVPGWPHGV